MKTFKVIALSGIIILNFCGIEKTSAQPSPVFAKLAEYSKTRKFFSAFFGYYSFIAGCEALHDFRKARATQKQWQKNDAAWLEKINSANRNNNPKLEEWSNEVKTRPGLASLYKPFIINTATATVTGAFAYGLYAWPHISAIYS